MNARKFRHLDRNAAEMLLRGDVANPTAYTGPVADLLAAVSAPARGRELAGEAEAVAAFRVAHLRPITRPRRSSMSVTKLLVAKAVLAAVGVSGSGVALAAATGHLHAGIGGSPASGSASASAAATSSSKTHGNSNSPSPSPSMRGLCRAYTSRGSNPGKALDNPAFSALIRAAGGKDNVSAYCTRELASKPGKSNNSHGHAGNPPGQSGDHPVGKPTSHP